ncbi:hypothetical protein [Gordonibacter massiliensis (ex Traore et al. 2017)]|uniref:hypothetical protein n=1 Tax=Gordonibacter massiliensis (ex Traore et al. 2017) TaxID=1841863 RepID=UPI001C8B27B7|nr:hypothetical protein [Gordonibacter massiliensis (ex Traore et al. 2017)]MBX9035158.1 hypothetical protein [Gordonibacter massiliensis (ex Traore et al. 2017)]
MIQEKYGDYELSSYDRVALTLPDFTVSDQDVAAEMERIAARHATNVTIDPHPVRADDLVLMNIKTREGENPFPGLTHDNVDVQLGVGSLPEEAEVALLGHEVGDVVEARFPYVDYSQVASEREAPADGGCGVGEAGEPETVELVSRMEIVALRRFVTPEITDAWVAKNIALSSTVEEFRERTASRLLRERRRAYANNVEYLVMDEIGKRLKGELPAEVVGQVVKQMMREFDRFLEQYELDRAAYLAIQGLDDVAFAERIDRDARDRVAQDIALASWATRYGIELDDSDIDFMFGEPTPERTYEARVEAEQSGQIDTFKDLALRAKVAELVTRDALFLTPDGAEDKGFKHEIDAKYRKQQMVRAHATSDPMLKPPLVPLR